MSRKRWTLLLMMLPLFFALAGCSIVLQKKNPQDAQQIDSLNKELRKEREAREELLRAQKELEEQLRKEIEEKNVRIDMAKRGLVITFVAEILFDSGKAQVKKDAYPILAKVANVLNNQVADRNIAIEGHTDNQPIKHSGWKSNWELSTTRATAVLHYLVDDKGIDPKRLSAVGYGEHRPVASNDTAEGKQKNRRVEITILPDKITRLNPDEQRLVPQPDELK